MALMTHTGRLYGPHDPHREAIPRVVPTREAILRMVPTREAMLGIPHPGYMPGIPHPGYMPPPTMGR